MESTRTHRVRDRWERQTDVWPHLKDGWLPVNLPPPEVRSYLPGTDDDELPPTSLIAAQSERSCRNDFLEAADLVALHVDMAALESAVERQSELDIDRLLFPDLFAVLLTERFTPRLQTVFRHGVDHEAGLLRQRGVPVKQLAVDLSEPYRQAAAWARQHAGELITAIRTQQRAAIRRLIARANEEGLSVRAVAEALRRTIGLRPDQVEAVTHFRQRLRRQGISGDRLQTRVNKYREAQKRRRAMLVARTEMIASVNAGQLALWGEAVRVGGLPRNSQKVWIVTEDERLCPKCEELGAIGPIPWNSAFDGVSLLAPPAHPACRCAVGLA